MSLSRGKRIGSLIVMARFILVVVICTTLLTPVMALDFPDMNIGTKTPKDMVYTLYRNSILGKKQRHHVATFDADVNEDYNRENCKIARDLFQNQPEGKVEYWCEKGFFKK